MIIDNTNGKLEEVLQYAESIGRKDNLQECIKHIDISDDTVEIYVDFAPKSFYFIRKRNEIFAGNGGIIFHGSHDNGGDGSFPTFSISILNDIKPHWEIHT